MSTAIEPRRRKGAEGAQRLRNRVVSELRTTFASHYTQVIGLAEALKPEVLRAYEKRATGEKFLIDPTRGYDLKFINSGQTPLLLDASVTDETLRVALGGTTPSWSVQVSEPTITAREAPNGDPTRLDEPDLPVSCTIAAPVNPVRVVRRVPLPLPWSMTPLRKSSGALIA